MVSYYYNSGAEYVFETIEDLKLLKENELVRILETVNGFFPNSIPSKDLEERNDVISSWDGKHTQLLEQLDDEFFARDAKLEEILVDYIIKNNLVSINSNQQ